MKYPYYKVPEQFEPSQSTLKLWLNSRKSKTTSGGGLFGTENYNIDRSWFLFAFSIEVIAFIVTILGGIAKSKFSHSPKAFIIACTGAILFIILDFIGVFIHHKNTDSKNEALSEMNYTHDSVILGHLKKKASNSISSTQFWGFICILISAALKIIALLALVTIFRKISYVIILFYIIVIYIHTKYTGYWYFAWRTQKNMDKEFSVFTFDKASGKPSKFDVASPPHKIHFSSYHLIQTPSLVLNDRVEIKLVNTQNITGNHVYNYDMTCKGYLWDEDIVPIISQYDSSFQTDLYEACVKIQHRQLGKTVLGGSIPMVSPTMPSDI